MRTHSVVSVLDALEAVGLRQQGRTRATFVPNAAEKNALAKEY